MGGYSKMGLCTGHASGVRSLAPRRFDFLNSRQVPSSARHIGQSPSWLAFSEIEAVQQTEALFGQRWRELELRLETTKITLRDFPEASRA